MLSKNERVYTPHGDGAFFEYQRENERRAMVVCWPHRQLEIWHVQDIHVDRRDPSRRG